MDPRHLFVLADRALEKTVLAIRDDQWDMTMPADFQTASLDHVPTLREIVGYHAYDDAWMPDMAAGCTMDEVGAASFDGDLLGSDPKTAFNAIVDKAVAAVETMDLDTTLHFSYGDWPAADGLLHVISFRGLRAHDIAKAIDADAALNEELAQGMYDALAPTADGWRQMGVFGPEVIVPADAPVQDRLLGLTGRQPDGTYAA